MSYAATEAAIIARMISLGYFDANNTDRNNWSKLDNGKQLYYAIARPGIA